jgi:serine phosphatase RsbU (regulator of sigma subunit)
MKGTEPKARVLVAEDQEHVREALAMLLRSDGYAVEMCSSPQEAVATAQRQMPEIALLDMNYQRDSTSGIEGLELIQKLRTFDNTLPIIALTGWGNVDLAVKAMQAGANDFIEKPWRNQALLEKVESLTGRARSLRSSQRVSEFERQDAMNLQTRIVPPRHLTTGGIEVHGETCPAGVVGGDYFGVWQPTSDSLHLCVADVSGKGTPGAMIAAMLYASVSTLSASGSTPDLILREVENLLRQQLSDDHYVTIFYAVLDLRTRRMEYVNAGHCPPIVQRASGDIEQLSATRPVLGFAFETQFNVERIQLRDGDRLLLYTDGITEATDSDGNEFGADGLTQALATTREFDPEEQRGAILTRVREYANGRFADDATLVILSITSAASAAAETNMATSASRF